MRFSMRSVFGVLALVVGVGIAACGDTERGLDETSDGVKLVRQLWWVLALVVSGVWGFFYWRAQGRRANLVTVRLVFTRDASGPEPWTAFESIAARAEGLGSDTPIGRAFRARESALVALSQAKRVVLAESEATEHPLPPKVVRSLFADRVVHEEGAFAVLALDLAPCVEDDVFYVSFVLVLNRSVRRWPDPTGLREVRLMLEQLASVASPQVDAVRIVWSPATPDRHLKRTAVLAESPKLTYVS